MVIAQVIIITPNPSIAHQSLRESWSEYHDLLISMNTSNGSASKHCCGTDLRALMTACLRDLDAQLAIGAIMIVGGNIDHDVLTTAISLETSRGFCMRWPWGLC